MFLNCQERYNNQVNHLHSVFSGFRHMLHYSCFWNNCKSPMNLNKLHEPVNVCAVIRYQIQVCSSNKLYYHAINGIDRYFWDLNQNIFLSNSLIKRMPQPIEADLICSLRIYPQVWLFRIDIFPDSKYRRATWYPNSWPAGSGFKFQIYICLKSQQ